MVWLLAPSGVSKESNAHLPVLGAAIRALNCVFIPYDKLSKSKSGFPEGGAPGGGPASPASLPPAGSSSPTAPPLPASRSPSPGAPGASPDGSPLSSRGASPEAASEPVTPKRGATGAAPGLGGDSPGLRAAAEAAGSVAAASKRAFVVRWRGGGG